MPRARPPNPAIRVRLQFADGRALGPGKADLLEAIAGAGSIAAAGRAMAMSYKRAWQLVDDLNRSFAQPLVRASKGGGRGGGAELTPTGTNVLAAYRRLQRKAAQAAAADIGLLARLAKTR